MKLSEKLKVMVKYIDNTNENQDVISLLTIGGETTRHGTKYRLRKVIREIDSTYNLNEAMHMVRTSKAVIRFYTEDELGKMIMNSDLNVVDEAPDYDYLNTSKSPELYLI